MASYIQVHLSSLFSSHTRSHKFADLKPENVLIALDDVESLIQAELEASAASATPPPTRLIGVPPSKGRGGNQTPRSDSIYITGSQPLPSPSSSYSSTSALDKLGFGMSKIDDQEGSKPGSMNDRAGSTEEAQRKLSTVSLETSPDFDKHTASTSSTGAGPSLLSQQAPGRSSEATSPDSSLQRDSAVGRSIGGRGQVADDLNGVVEEKITVKIADLGNGLINTAITAYFLRLIPNLSYVAGTPLYGRHSDAPVSLSRGYLGCQMGLQC